MSSIAINLIVFACVFGGAMLGPLLEGQRASRRRAQTQSSYERFAIQLARGVKSRIAKVLPHNSRGSGGSCNF